MGSQTRDGSDIRRLLNAALLLDASFITSA